MRHAVVFAVVSALTLVQVSMADQRPWVWTYGSAMMHPGEAEFEHYLTLRSPDWSRRESNLKAVHQAELEIGMSDRLDAAVYQVFSRTPGDPLDWDGFKLRLRWRLLPDPDAFAHPILYLEYKDDATLNAPVWESKLLLSQRFGPLGVAFNPILEFEEDETVLAAAMGLSLRVSPLLSVGTELRAGEDGLWLGPVISHGGDGLWTALGASWRVGDADPGELTHEVRLIIGVQVKD